MHRSKEDGRSSCTVAFEDGREATLWGHVYRELERGHGIFLGPEWEDQVAPITVPADLADGRDEIVLRGFSNAREIIAVATRFRDAIEDRDVEDGDIIFEEGTDHA